MGNFRKPLAGSGGVSADSKIITAQGITERLRRINELGGTERLAGKYKALIETQPDSVRKGLAVEKGYMLISVFIGKLNKYVRGNEDPVLDTRLEASAIRTLDIFGKFISRWYDESVAIGCISVARAIGDTINRDYAIGVKDDDEVHNVRHANLAPATVLSIARLSLDALDGMKHGSPSPESVLAKLDVLEWSVTCASHAAAQFDICDIPDIDVRGIARMHSTRDELVFAYLSRGLEALGGDRSLEVSRIVKNIFSGNEGIHIGLDVPIKGIIETHRGDKAATGLVIGINKKAADYLAMGREARQEFIEILRRCDAEKIARILQDVEVAN